MIKHKDKRLGAINDSEDIKKHKYMKDINWNKVSKKEHTSPFINYLEAKKKKKVSNSKYLHLVNTFGYPSNVNDILLNEVVEENKLNTNSRTFMENWNN